MKKPHISVCVCTFRRPRLLKRLLDRLVNQRTDGLFTYSAVIADNDDLRSAESTVSEFAATTSVGIAYCVEAQQNIALARNAALRHADGDFIAFIDDDEFPTEDWLFALYQTYVSSGADGVLGPVVPHFETEPPAWVKKGRFFERPRHSTGFKMHWSECRTGNVLFRRDIAGANQAPFRSQFDTAGEDIDFFRQMMNAGHSFVWCDEAIAYELVPASRCTRHYLLKRALLRGSNFSKHPTHRIRNGFKSLVALPFYVVSLPVLALLGQHVLLKYLIKVCDHASRLMAFAGIRLVTQRQT